MPHALDARDAVLDGLGDLGFELGRRRAELRDRHRDHRDIRIGQPRHRELGEGDPAQRQQDDREHDRGQRVADRPRRDVESHQRTCVRSRSSANTVLIWSPSCSEEPASATTISPSTTPSRISVELSDTRPTRTRRVSTVLPLTTCTVRWSMAVRGTATPQLRRASILARANIPTRSAGLSVSDIRTWPSWVLRSICGDTSRTRPARSGLSSRLIRTVAPGLSFSIWKAGTSASSSISLLTAIRNIGPACGEAGAPEAVLTAVTRPAAGARSEIAAACRAPGAGCGVSRASSWLSATRSPSRTSTSATLNPSCSTPATASRRGTTKPVTRTRSEKQPLAALATITTALLGASTGSERERCSNQYQPPPSAITAIAASAGLRYSESVIAGLIQDTDGGGRARSAILMEAAHANHPQTPIAVSGVIPAMQAFPASRCRARGCPAQGRG